LSDIAPKISPEARASAELYKFLGEPTRHGDQDRPSPLSDGGRRN
jgi:hypothetical protein